MSSSAAFRKIPRITIKQVSRGRVTSHKVLLSGGNVKETGSVKEGTSHIVPEPSRHEPQNACNEEQLHLIQEHDALSSIPNEWDTVRGRLFEAYFSQNVFSGKSCIYCKGNIGDEHIKCKDCSTTAYFCSEHCYTNLHTEYNCNPFHKPMKWLSQQMKYTDFYTGVTLIRYDHTCNSQRTRTGIQVYDKAGRVHLIAIAVCDCEEDCITFLRHGLWSATVKEPRTAFHLELLNLVEFMMLEGKTSLLAICQAIRWANNLTVKQTETLYERLSGEPIDQYRHFMYQARSMNFLSDVMDDGTECLACPKFMSSSGGVMNFCLDTSVQRFMPNLEELKLPNLGLRELKFYQNGDLFMCLDGNVGLVRKRSAGSSSGYGNHGNRLFICNDVPEDYSENRKHTEECNNFQAGTIIRPHSSTKKLEVSGVFGGACRHGIPKAFVDMKRGESFCYAVAVIDKIVDKAIGKNLNIHILYDVGCKLDVHLKATKDLKYKDVAVALPVFHAYGHKPSCQMKYSARWNKGFGLTDGETMERLWSYLRRFSFITKEMTAAHRRDLLTDALLHYAKKKNMEMDFTLASNMEKAHDVFRETYSDLEVYCDTLSLSASDLSDIVRQEKQSLSASSMKDFHLNEEEKYVTLITDLGKARETLAKCTVSDLRDAHQERIARLNNDLMKYEKRLGIQERWTTADQDFEINFTNMHIKQKKSMLLTMYNEAGEYEFSTSLKGKYGDRNQKIAIKVKSQIIRASKSIKRTLKKYNSYGFKDTCGNIPDELQYSDVSKPDCDVYGQLFEIHDAFVEPTSVPKKVARKIAEIMSRHERASEEKDLIEREMLSLLDSLGQQHAHILQVLKSLTVEAPIGIDVALIQLLEEHQIKYFRARKIFSKWMFDLPDIPSDLLSVDIKEVIDNIIIESASHITTSDTDSSDDEDC